MARSYATWALWIVAFLPLELLGFFRVFGLVTFSETVWKAETYPLVAPLVFATLLTLIAHFLYHKPLWASVLFALTVSVAAHLCDKHWP